MSIASFLLALGAAAISSACIIVAVPATPDQNSAAAWPRVYGGGDDNQVFLILQADQRYRLLQNSQQAGKRRANNSNGQFSTNDSGNIITLTAPDGKVLQRYWAGENFLQQQGARGDKRPDQTAAATPRLQRLQRYHQGAEELLIAPDSIKADPAGSGQIHFAGLWNMPPASTQSGHASLFAQFVLDCQAKSYSMPEITYYTKAWRQGEILHQASNNDNPLAISDQDALMGSLFKAWCR